MSQMQFLDGQFLDIPKCQFFDTEINKKVLWEEFQNKVIFQKKSSIRYEKKISCVHYYALLRIVLIASSISFEVDDVVILFCPNASEIIDSILKMK